jgi:hypothetical protein
MTRREMLASLLVPGSNVVCKLAAAKASCPKIIGEVPVAMNNHVEHLSQLTACEPVDGVFPSLPTQSCLQATFVIP